MRQAEAGAGGDGEYLPPGSEEESVLVEPHCGRCGSEVINGPFQSCCPICDRNNVWMQPCFICGEKRVYCCC